MITLVCVAAGCGTGGAGKASSRTAAGARPRPELAVSALIPHDVTYALIARRASALVQAIRDGVEPLRVVDRTVTFEAIGGELRRDLGFNPLDLGDFEDAGLAVDRDLALFSSGVEPTVALPLEDRAALDKFLTAHTAKVTKYALDRHGTRVTWWRSGNDAALSYAVTGDYLLLHLHLRPSGAAAGSAARAGAWRPDHAWLDEIVAARAGKSLARVASFVRLLAHAGARRDLVGVLELSAVNRATQQLMSGRPTSCAALDERLDSLGRVLLTARLRPRRVDLALAAELAPPAREELASNSGGGPQLPAALWKDAPLRVGISVDPGYVAGVLQQFDKRACGPIYQLLGELRPLASALAGQRLLRYLQGRGAAALFSAEEKGQGTLHLRAAVVGMASKRAAEYLRSELALPASPGARVAGEAVWEVTSKTQIAQRVRLALSGGTMRLTVGDGLMETLLAHQTVPAPSDTLLSVRIRPGKISDLRAPLKLLEAPPKPASSWMARHRSGSGYREIDQLVHLLSSFETLALEVTRTKAGLRAQAELVLR